MLKMEERITLTGRTIIDGKEVCRYQANISSENPSDVTFSEVQVNKELYKENRSVRYAEREEFENHVYELQDSMLAKAENKEVEE